MRSPRSSGRRLPSPALVVACLALAVALGGVGYAAVVLPPKSVGTKHLKDNAVTSKKIKNGTVKKVDVAPGVVPAGPTVFGTNAPHPSVAVTAIAGEPSDTLIRTLPLPAGTFYVIADVIVINSNDAEVARPRCFLRGTNPLGGGFTGLLQPLAPNGTASAWRIVMPLAGWTRLTAPGEVRVECNKILLSEEVLAIATLTAIRVAAVNPGG